MTASTLAQYLAALPADGRAALIAVRKVIRSQQRVATSENLYHRYTIPQLQDAEYYHPTKIEIISVLGDQPCRKLGTIHIRVGDKSAAALFSTRSVLRIWRR